MHRIIAPTTTLAVGLMALAAALPATAQENGKAAMLSLSTLPESVAHGTQAPALYQHLITEIATGLSPDHLRCLDGAAPPCTEGAPMLTPAGIVIGRDAKGAVTFARPDNQINRVNAEGQLVPRVKAAQPDQADTGLRITQHRVIRADQTRRSDQDFETQLRDALIAARNAPADDLTRALIETVGTAAMAQTIGKDGDQIALAAPDRLVIQTADGRQKIVKDDNALLLQSGNYVTTEEFDDGSSRIIVTRPDGSKVVTIRDAALRVLRRTLIAPDGKTTRLIDDSAGATPVDVTRLPPIAAPQTAPTTGENLNQQQLRDALTHKASTERNFTLQQIRDTAEIRALVPPIDLNSLTFNTGSAALHPNQRQHLTALGQAIRAAINANPREIFLIEGHTDTVGTAAMNLALSDRRAESVARALTEHFNVPPENLIVQGYGETALKIAKQGPVRANRRASVRRITDLLNGSRI